MTNPFQSILLQPGTLPKPANDEHMSLEDIIAGAFSRASSSYSSTASGARSTIPPSGTAAPTNRPPLTGGDYSERDALQLINQYYCIGWNDNETAVFRKNDDGTLSFVADQQFKLEVQNIFVQAHGRRVPVEKYWKESPSRDKKTLVFKPGGTTQPDEYNLWRGFGVEPRKGWQKQRRFYGICTE